MKKQYCSPSAKKIDYTYDDQVVATSPGGFNGWWGSIHSSKYCQVKTLACDIYFMIPNDEVPCKE